MIEGGRNGKMGEGRERGEGGIEGREIGREGGREGRKNGRKNGGIEGWGGREGR